MNYNSCLFQKWENFIQHSSLELKDWLFGVIVSRHLMMFMMMMMMNCFCGMVDWRKVFSLISSRDHCQRSSPSRIFDTPRAGFEACAEPEFRLCWMNLCSSHNHYTTAPVDNHHLNSFFQNCASARHRSLQKITLINVRLFFIKHIR